MSDLLGRCAEWPEIPSEIDYEQNSVRLDLSKLMNITLWLRMTRMVISLCNLRAYSKVSVHFPLDGHCQIDCEYVTVDNVQALRVCSIVRYLVDR